MKKTARILIAGHDTMIGRALATELREQGYAAVFPGEQGFPDWGDRTAVRHLFETVRPDHVFCAAGKSGGIGLNRTHPADLMFDNLKSILAVIEAARDYGTAKLLYLASSCCYPRECPQPIPPGALMTGPLEPTNEAYATAKLAGILLCQACRQEYGSNFIAAIPATPFGPGDHFDEENSHVIGALIRRIHAAKTAGAPTVTIWGSGQPRRDFIYVRDLAHAAIFLMQTYNEKTPVNIGVNQDLSIAELAERIKAVVGFSGHLVFDTSKPDGMLRKCLDANALASMGWQARFSFQAALEETVRWYAATGPQHA